MTQTPIQRRALLLGLAAVLWIGVGLRTQVVWEKRTKVHESLASDALPIYLAGAAVLDGHDPTQAASLIDAYERRGMGTGALFFSTLYPASVGVMAAPLAQQSWVDFLGLWRFLVLLGALGAGVAGGAAAVRGPATWIAAPLGGLVAMAGFPLLEKSLGLGQANLIIAGLVGLCMLGLSRGWGILAGSAAAVGVAVKLVPGLLFWPMLAGRSWRAIIAGIVVGGALAGWTISEVPIDQVWSGIMGTIHFQQGVFPDWMNRHPAPDWMIFLGALRGLPMGAMTLGAIGVCCWRADPAQLPAVLTASAAIATAWLATHAAAVGVFYGTLLLPALAYAALWPISGALHLRRLAWVALIGLVQIGAALHPELAEEPRMVLYGMAVWLVCTMRLAEVAPPMPRWGRMAAAAVIGAGLVMAGVRVTQGPILPPMPEDGMDAMPQGHGAGVGGVGPERNWNPDMPQRMPGQGEAPPPQKRD